MRLPKANRMQDRVNIGLHWLTKKLEFKEVEIFMSKILSKFKLASTAVLISSIAGASSSLAANYYQVIDLGTLEGTVSEGFSVNDDNNVVGVSNGEDFNSHAFIYRDATQEIIDLGHLEYERVVTDSDGNVTAVLESGRSSALDINNSGIAVGSSTQFVEVGEDSDGNPISVEVNYGVYFDTDTLTLTLIPQVDTESPTDTLAVAINQNQLITGTTKYDPPNDSDSSGNPVSTTYERGFFYDIGTQEFTLVQALDPDAEGQFVVMRDLNDNGVGVGISTRVEDERNIARIIIVDVDAPDSPEELDVFGGFASYPWAINNSGIVVGKATLDNSSTEQAFMYDSETKVVTELGYLNDSFKASEAIDINETNQIVGRSRFQNSPAIYHAFLYEDGVMKDLNKLIDCDSGWILNEARAINDATEGAVITGTGVVNGEKHAFMLKPLEGTAPSCEVEEEKSGSGSLPFISLVGLLLLGFRRARV
jgi:probable HAF family extracellular repeat protein